MVQDDYERRKSKECQNLTTTKLLHDDTKSMIPEGMKDWTEETKKLSLSPLSLSGSSLVLLVTLDLLLVFLN